MKFCVLSYADGDLDEWGRVSFANKRAYSDRHGYTFVGLTEPVDRNLPAGWQKILACRQLLGEFDWLFWSDADSLVMNHAVRLDLLLDAGRDLIFGSDERGVNSGHFLIRNSEWSRGFLERLLTDPYRNGWKYAEHDHELNAFRNLLDGEYSGDSRILVTSQAVMNSYPDLAGYRGKGARNEFWRYEPGHFVIRFAGRPGREAGLERFREMAGVAGIQTGSFIRPAYDVRVLNRGNALACADRFTTRMPEYPEGDFEGRGITICGGGVRYFTCAWVCVRMLRELGCELPIELWYLGSREIDSRMKALLEPFGVEFVDALEVRRSHPVRSLGGWELKPYSILHSRFDEVLALDADNVAVLDPTYLFAEPEYRRTGAIFWPDFGRFGTERPVWDIFGVEYRDEPEFESGQIVVNKRKCWRALQLAMFYNEHSDFYYRHIHGDKDTFHLAFRRLGIDYAMPDKPIESLSDVVMCQHDLRGRRVFQHRNLAKWTLQGRNRRIEGFHHEDACRAYLAMLRAQWNGVIRPETAPALVVAGDVGMAGLVEELIGNRFLYRRLGHDERYMEFLPGGRIGTGAGGCERAWAVEIRAGVAVLTLSSERESTCRLERCADAVWRGQWFAYEQMAVELLVP